MHGRLLSNDGFGNKVGMVAYANPDPQRKKVGAGAKEGRADGWGLIRFGKKSGEVTFERWPRFTGVTQPGAKQFPGWPVTVKP